MKKITKGILRRIGFDIVRYRPHHHPEALRDLTDQETRILELVKPYTLTSEERIAALLNAVGYVTERKIPGALAECGVWRGGSMMAVALALIYHGDLNRDLYLYTRLTGW